MQRLSARTKTATLGGAALVATAVALASTGAAPAGSATNTGLTIDTPCVRDDGSKVKFHLAGFPGGATVSLYKDATESLGDATVGSDGSFAGSFTEGSNGDKFYIAHTVSASDFQGSTGSGTYAVVTLGAVPKPKSTKPTAKVSYYAQGFVEGGTLYAHYAYSKSDTVKVLKKTVALGKLTGPCGTITTKKVTQLPLTKPKSGVYEIQLDTSQAYHRQQGVYIETTIFVPKK